MSKTAKRLLTFFIGIPLVLLIVFTNYMNSLALHIAIGIFSVLGANEFYNMLKINHSLFPKPLLLIFTALLPYLTFLFILYDFKIELIPWVYLFEVLLLMGIECFSAKTFEKSLSKIAYSSLLLFYCGFLLTFLSRLTVTENSTYIISLFLIFVFICDSLAWFFGVLFGKSTRGYVAASPNKSLVGFIGGISCSILAGFLFKCIFTERLPFSYIEIFILGFLTAIASIVGDLIESVFKRSSGVKDSGNLIPGRGGVLDSIDSIVIAVPVFYICQYCFSLY